MRDPSPNALMLVGGSTWLTGELMGVYRNAKERGHNDTTSEWVWAAELRWPLVRTLVATFVLSLLGHFMAHTELVP